MRLLLTLLACVGGGDDDKTETADTQVEDTGPAGPSAAFVALAIRLPHGALDSTCRIGFTLTEVGTDAVVADVEVAARGEEWAGVSIPGGGTFRLSGNDHDCTDISDELPFETSAFSLVDGQVGVWAWKATQEGFSTIDEADEWVRGRAVVEVDPGSPAEDAIAAAEALGATATASKEAADTLDLTFAEDLSVPAVLVGMSEYGRYVSGEPVWRSGRPSWW